MEVRDAVESDAEALASLSDIPEDVLRNLIHDRTVRVAVASETDGGEAADETDLRGFVSFDVRDQSVHVTQLAGTLDVSERLLEEPVGFAAAEGMDVELLVPEADDQIREAVTAAGFEQAGTGPRFRGEETVRYRLEPSRR